MHRERIRTCVTELVDVATGGDRASIDKVRSYPMSKNGIKDLLYEVGLPQAEVVKHDSRRALNGRRPKYFAHGQRLTEEYRARRNIPRRAKQFGGGEMVTTEEVTESILNWLKDDGPKDWFRRDGLACPNEQSSFYESEEWSRRAKAIRAMDWFECQSCGAQNKELHVHHVQPIYSAFGRMLHRNFDVVRMRTLCKDCHYEVHQGAVKDSHGFVYPDTEEEMRKAQEFHEHMIEGHDEARECEWCHQFVWD